MKDIGEYLKNNGIKPSYQRIKIFEYIITKKNHPTVDMIYKELADHIPTLSRTTVYNTLNLFVEKNVAIMLQLKENESRYDADVSLHGHFKCLQCENIYDFEIDASSLRFKNLGSVQLNEIQVICKGICTACNDKNKTYYV